jgi:hypothetical protein
MDSAVNTTTVMNRSGTKPEEWLFRYETDESEYSVRFTVICTMKAPNAQSTGTPWI